MPNRSKFSGGTKSNEEEQQVNLESPTLSASYLADVAAGKITRDNEQLRVLAELERLAADLLRHAAPLSPLQRIAGLLGRAESAPLGVYLWGGVGRGKTYLMDLFYDSLDTVPRRRTHFHRFMQEVHQRLTALQGEKNPLQILAKELAVEVRLLCFDEFFVQDIADAMLLAGLLEALFAEGVVLVATSNIEPQGLYRNGLQRERFLPAIALLDSHTKVIEVASGSDYRLRSLEQATLYHCPDGEQARAAMRASMEELVANADHIKANQSIEVLGRHLCAQLLGDGVVWFGFAELCDGPRSAFDYVELARLFEAVLITGVPAFDDSRNDQARRFINLVDELYDRRVKLIIAADAPIVELYQGTQLSFEFERTASRLLEMQSLDYLGAAHKA